MDLFLVSVHDSCPFGSVKIRAFADDIGISVWRLKEFWPILIQELKEFEDVSNLTLNLKKTMFIPWKPLFPGGICWTCINWSEWSGFLQPTNCVKFVKYFGIYIGPGVTSDLNWEGPLKRFVDGCEYRSGLGIPTFFRVLALNIYCLSVLSLVPQFWLPSAKTLGVITRKLFIALRGQVAGRHIKFCATWRGMASLRQSETCTRNLWLHIFGAPRKLATRTS